MALEIERKFLVKKCVDIAGIAVRSHEITQGYLSDNRGCTVRVRIKDDSAFLTVKSRTEGFTRHEWEYRIPKRDAEEMLALPGVKTLSKTRFIVPVDNMVWEVDKFHGKLEGLILAEIELPNEDSSFRIPNFILREVTGDARYYNSNLIGADSVPR